MSTFAFPAHSSGRPDGVRPRHLPPRKARKESRKRPVRTAHDWPAWTDGTRYGVLDPACWPRWTSDVRIATRKGR